MRRAMTSAVHLRNASAGEVAAILREPSPPAEVLDARLRSALSTRLRAILPRRGGPRHRIDGYVVEKGAPSFTGPFLWNARAARRVLGTPAARAVASGVAGDPLTAAASEVDRLATRSVRPGARPGGLALWLASAPEVVRSLCALEAAGWATSLLGCVETSSPLGSVAVGIPDAWFEVPGAPVTLHGRRDAAVGAPSGADCRLSLLRLRDGLPGPRAVEGLALDGLVDALSAPERPLPARVVGVWPDAGVTLVVAFDGDVARAAAREVLVAAERLARPLQTLDSVPEAA
jgi:hypothetical protein